MKKIDPWLASQAHEQAVAGLNQPASELAALREELEEARKDYACLARELDGHDATECLMNLRRLKEELVSLLQAQGKAVQP